MDENALAFILDVGRPPCAGKCLMGATGRTKEEQGCRRRHDKGRGKAKPLLYGFLYTHICSIRIFNPDWHAGERACATSFFNIESAPELSTWINKSRSYLAKQNWISPPKDKAGMEEAVSTFILVLPSYRDRILFFCLCGPWRVISSPRACNVQRPYVIPASCLSAAPSPRSFSSFFSTNFYMWRKEKQDFLNCRLIYTANWISSLKSCTSVFKSSCLKLFQSVLVFQNQLVLS